MPVTQLHRDLHGTGIGGPGGWEHSRQLTTARPGRIFTALYVIGCTLVLLFGFLSICAHQLGLSVPAAVGVVLLSAAAVAMLWLCTPGGERLVNAIADRRDVPHETSPGTDMFRVVSLRVPVPSWVWLSLVFCILVQIGLSVLRIIPAGLMQPLSLIWALPLLYYASGLFMKRAHPLMALWPGLYAFHAVLVMAGSPLTLGAPLQALDILIPATIYGLIASGAAFVHRRLVREHTRAIARSPQVHRCVRGRKHVGG